MFYQKTKYIEQNFIIKFDSKKENLFRVYEYKFKILGICFFKKELNDFKSHTYNDCISAIYRNSNNTTTKITKSICFVKSSKTIEI